MDFALNEQQEMMQALARDFLADEYTDKVLKATVEDEKGHSPELWWKLAEINLTALAIPEEYGGVGDFLDLIVVLEEMGSACFISPFFTAIVLGASTIIEAGSEELSQDSPDRSTTMVLVKSPLAAKQLYDGGVQYAALNIGGIGSGPGRKNIFKNIAVSKEEIVILKQLVDQGVDITLLTVPGEKSRKFSDLARRL